MRDLQDMTILAVDDDNTTLSLLRAVLKKSGYHDFVTAGSGEAGLEMLKNYRVDLILTDIMMPGMDGFEMCRRVRSSEMDSRTPIIVMTAMGDRDAIKRSIDAGATDFVTKPIASIELLSRVRSALTLKQHFDGLEEELLRRKQAEERVRERNELLKSAHGEIESLYQGLQREYEIAGGVFSRVMRADYADFSNIRFVSAPVATVGGDLFLVARKPSGGMHALVGDFTGHGLSAAIGVIPVADIFHAMSQKDYSIGAILAEVNRKLKAVLPTGLFFCACFLELSSTYDTLTLWNGGMPDVFLVGAEGGIKQRFPSANLPLGIVDTAQLDKRGQVVSVAKGDRVYAYTDGIIEARNPEGEIYGQERLERSFHGGDHELLFDQVFNDFLGFHGDSARIDDVILAEITCGPPNEGAVSNPHGSASKPLGWKMSVDLGPDELRSDPLEFVMRMLMEVWELRKHKENIYLILAELFSNALDYGVLGLDAALRASPEGFAEYFSLREKAMSAFETGWIKIDVQLTPHSDGSMLLVRLEDSGSGFQYLSENECALSENIACHGRGIQLLRSMCKSLEYNKKGNCAEAVYVC